MLTARKVQAKPVEKEPIVINLFDFAAVKNNLEDQIREVREFFARHSPRQQSHRIQAALDATEDFQEDHKNNDFRLWVYTAACLFAGVR
jgi:hypothetical protein